MTGLLEGKGKADCALPANAGFLSDDTSMTFRLFKA